MGANRNWSSLRREIGTVSTCYCPLHCHRAEYIQTEDILYVMPPVHTTKQHNLQFCRLDLQWPKQRINNKDVHSPKLWEVQVTANFITGVTCEIENAHSSGAPAVSSWKLVVNKAIPQEYKMFKFYYCRNARLFYFKGPRTFDPNVFCGQLGDAPNKTWNLVHRFLFLCFNM